MQVPQVPQDQEKQQQQQVQPQQPVQQQQPDQQQPPAQLQQNVDMLLLSPPGIANQIQSQQQPQHQHPPFYGPPGFVQAPRCGTNYQGQQQIQQHQQSQCRPNVWQRENDKTHLRNAERSPAMQRPRMNHPMDQQFMHPNHNHLPGGGDRNV